MTMTNKRTNEHDRRLLNVDFEVRELSEGEGTIITGMALRFNKPSEDLGFIETLDERCLDGADMSNVVALVNHDSNQVLGRTGKNLRLRVTDEGLSFEIDPVDTSYTRDLMKNMRAGLIDKCSFAFSIAKDGDEWRKRSDGKYERTVTKIDRLYDVSVVTSPAYEDTEAMLSERSKEAYMREKATETPEQRERREEIEKLEREMLELGTEVI